MSPLVGPVLDQGQTPSCTCYSTVGAKQHEDQLTGGHGFLPYDPPTLYREAKQVDGDPQGDGTQLRVVLDIAQQTGVPLTDGSEPRKIGPYYGVPVDYDTIKQVIYQLGAVLIGVEWPSTWFSPHPNGLVPPPAGSAGGHALWIFGWDDETLALSLHPKSIWIWLKTRIQHPSLLLRRPRFCGPTGGNLIVRNSWGESWGLHGNFYLPAAYLGQVFEVWKFVDVAA